MDKLLERISNLSADKQRLLQLMRANARHESTKTKTRPLSYAQRRLWFISQLDPGSAAYNIHFGIRLTGKLNQLALENSLNEIIRRHEVLRTRFVMEGDEPLQQIASELELNIEKLGLLSVTNDEREAEAQRIAREEAIRIFDLSHAPLLRVKLIGISENDQVLLVTMHHIVSDGWSTGIIIEELNALYEANLHGQPSPLRPLVAQYGDFAVWQREWLQGPVLEQQLGYWRKQLADMAILAMPADFKRPSKVSHRGEMATFHLSTELSEKLKETSRRNGLTLFMTMLAGFQLLLSRYSGQADVAVGTPIANRTRPEIEKLIGFFVNTLVLRTAVRESDTLSELLQRVKETTLAAYGIRMFLLSGL